MGPLETYIKNTLVTTSVFIVATKPLIAISDGGLMDNLANVEEEIASKGGFLNMGPETFDRLSDELNNVLNEIAARN